MPRKLLLPGFRRSTFRAPDPEAAARFDLELPGATTEPERRRPAELAELAELRVESIETALEEQRRLVEERLLADLAEDARRDAPESPAAPGPEVARSSFVRHHAEERAPHPRHRADRIGNRRPTSGRRRPRLAG